MKVTVETVIDGSDILQLVTQEFDIREMHQKQVLKWTMKTQEAGVRKALITIGWMPPPEDKL